MSCATGRTQSPARRRSVQQSFESGFALIELLVAVTISMMVLILATDLLRLSHATVADTAVEIVARDREGLRTLLRRDVEWASSAATDDPSSPMLGQWTTNALVLRQDSGTVIYRREDNRILRQVLEADQDPSEAESAQTLLANASAWRWRALGRLVEVEFARPTNRRRGDLDGQLSERRDRLTLLRRVGTTGRW